MIYHYQIEDSCVNLCGANDMTKVGQSKDIRDYKQGNNKKKVHHNALSKLYMPTAIENSIFLIYIPNEWDLCTRVEGSYAQFLTQELSGSGCSGCRC